MVRSSFPPVNMMPFETHRFNGTWTNMPAAQTEFLGNDARRTEIDLSQMQEVRLLTGITVAGAAAAKIWVQYSINLVDWISLEAAGAMENSIAVTGLTVSAWFPIALAARRVVTLRYMGSGGDGILDPGIGGIVLQLR